jgi:tRNA pseudouridine13 synthase
MSLGKKYLNEKKTAFKGLRKYSDMEILSEEDFVVKEKLSRKVQKFRRETGGMKKVDGPYTVLKLKKKGMTSEQAIKKAAKIYSIREKDIGLAGLKDKFAITEQYITIKNFFGENFVSDSLTIEKVGVSDRPLSPGDLEGNFFEITLHNCKEPKKTVKKIEDLKKKGMKNYFGKQRFGKFGDNHKIGLMILKRKFLDAMKKINSHGYEFKSIRSVPKKKLKFYIHAYQSHIFNKTLDELAENASDKGKIFGYDCKFENSVFDKNAKKILEKEKIMLKDFQISELGIMCRGGEREIRIHPIFNKIENVGDIIYLEFFLPAGSYATVLINEL